MNYVIAPYLKVGANDLNLIVGFACNQIIIKNLEERKEILKCLSLFKNKLSKEIFITKAANTLNIDINKAKRYFELFLKNKWIIDANYNPKDKFSRNHLYYYLQGIDALKYQDDLSLTHVGIVGCGGIGNMIAYNLLSLGITQFTLIDADIIEESNLTRQFLFTEGDIGQFKTTVLKKAMKLRNSSVKIIEIKEFIDYENSNQILPKCDLLVVSGDSSNINTIINKFSFEKNVPFINIGYIQDIAVWGPFIIPGKTPCYECFKKNNIVNKATNTEESELIKYINESYQAPSISATNMISAGLATIDIIKFFSVRDELFTLNKRVGLWTNELKFEKQQYDYENNCIICNEKY